MGKLVLSCFFDLGFGKAAGCGCKRFGKVRKGGFLVPLNEKVNFVTKLQQRNRFQVSKHVLWKYKLETNQTLKVTVSFNWSMINHTSFFLTRISKDGRIVIPKVNMDLLQDKKMDLAGYIVNVTLEPF